MICMGREGNTTGATYNEIKSCNGIYVQNFAESTLIVNLMQYVRSNKYRFHFFWYNNLIFKKCAICVA